MPLIAVHEMCEISRLFQALAWKMARRL